MKKIIVVLVLVIISGACSVPRKARPIVFQITVIDKNTSSPVDSAKVIFSLVTDMGDMQRYDKYTDIHGRCNFSVFPAPTAQYRVGSFKKGLDGYYDKSIIDFNRAFSSPTEQTAKNVILYMTSDTLNNRNFWVSQETRYEIDTLINLLRSNKYPLSSSFPLLLWEDIPELLAIGNSSQLIDKYPISIVSSSSPKDCYLGIISLWFIESIRITELKKTVVPYEKFPSFTPSLGYRADREGSESVVNSIEIMENAFKAYQKWWDKVKSLDKKNACRINPLENTNMIW
jgi:hypothetical protein